MFKKILFLILFFLLFPQKTFAATFTFDGAPSNISDTQSFSLNVVVSISNSSGKNYYIRPAFSHPDSPSSYFGYIKNNSGNWYNVSGSIDKTQLYMITMDDNDQWTGSIETKPDPESAEYKGSGSYNLKLGRYTETGSTVTWCNNETVSCSIASISITSSATPTPSSTPSSSSTAVPTPTPIKTPTPKPSTPKPTTTPIATSVSVALTDEEEATSSVMSESSSSSELEVLKDPTSEPIETKVASENNLQPIFIGAGIILLTGSGYLVFRSLRKNE